MGKLKLELQKDRETGKVDNLNQMIAVKVRDKNNKLRKIYMHGYLIGLELANNERANNKYQSMGLIIGGVGTGKSSLTKGMAGVNGTIRDTRLSLSNYSFTTNKFCSLFHQEEQKGLPQVFDESIEGIGKLNTTAKGDKLKRTVVTGRFQLHTSYFLVDELQEFHPKLIRMCDFMIRVIRFGNKRGYFEAFTDKRKIKFIYNGLKYYGKTWSSAEIKRIPPDCRGRFPDYSGVFFDEEEYDKLKLEQTREDEDEKDKRDVALIKTIQYLHSNGLTDSEIANETGYSRDQIGHLRRTVV